MEPNISLKRTLLWKPQYSHTHQDGISTSYDNAAVAVLEHF